MGHSPSGGRQTTPIFGPAAGPGAWTSLSTGVADCIVSLLVICKSAGSPHVAVRPVGNSGDFHVTGSSSASATATAILEQDVGSVLKCVTDSSGNIEWVTSGVGLNYEVYLLGFDTADIVDPTAAGSPFTTTLSTSWTNKDISSIIGTQRSLVLAETRKAGGFSGHWSAVREDGEAGNAICSTVALKAGGCAHWLHYGTAGYSYSPLFPVSSSGVFEAIRTTLNYDIDLYVHGYIDEANGWNHTSSVIYSTAAPPTSWTDLDLSSIVGSQAVEVYLKITRGAGGGGTLQRFAVRENGDTREYLPTADGKYGCQSGDIDEGRSIFFSVQTDSSGIIEWISDSAVYGASVEVAGYIEPNAPPSVHSVYPEDGSVTTELDRISLTIEDGVGYDTSTLVLKATDSIGNVRTIYDGGSGGFQTGYDGDVATVGGANPTRVTITVREFIDFESPRLWTFSIDGESISGGSL